MQTRNTQLAYSLSVWAVAVGWLLFCDGCQIAGLFAIGGSPTHSEQRLTAEYDITEPEGQSILVLVYQPIGLDDNTNLVFYVTKAFNDYLEARVQISPEYIISYDRVSRLRVTESDFSVLAPEQIGVALGADLVVFVMLDEYRLSEISQSGYQKGFLAVRAMLVDCATGKRLWPQADRTRTVKVGFEVQKRGPTAAAVHLAAAAAHCTLRYLYDCPKTRFKIAEDRTGVAWTEWN